MEVHLPHLRSAVCILDQLLCWKVCRPLVMYGRCPNVDFGGVLNVDSSSAFTITVVYCEKNLDKLVRVLYRFSLTLKLPILI